MRFLLTQLKNIGGILNLEQSTQEPAVQGMPRNNQRELPIVMRKCKCRILLYVPTRKM
jgi:hypothetical protein